MSKRTRNRRATAAHDAPAVRSAPAIPGHVVIVGLGPSCLSYMDRAMRLGGRHAFCDEVWAINALGAVIECDRIFHMDDVRVQEARAAAKPDSNIAQMLRWMRHHPGPIYTSRAHPDYPGLVEFPLEEVINSCGMAYFNSTAAYAVAYAVHLGVKQITCYGMDFTYPNAHQAEKGRACVEFHLAIGHARGIRIGLPEKTTLMDSIAINAGRQDEFLYGYDTLDVSFEGGGEELCRVIRKERTRLATAAEIEARYDHSRHPNALVSEQKEPSS